MLVDRWTKDSIWIFWWTSREGMCLQSGILNVPSGTSTSQWMPYLLYWFILAHLLWHTYIYIEREREIIIDTYKSPQKMSLPTWFLWVVLMSMWVPLRFPIFWDAPLGSVDALTTSAIATCEIAALAARYGIWWSTYRKPTWQWKNLHF